MMKKWPMTESEDNSNEDSIGKSAPPNSRRSPWPRLTRTAAKRSGEVHAESGSPVMENGGDDRVARVDDEGTGREFDHLEIRSGSWEQEMFQKPAAATPAFSMRAYWSSARLTWKITGTFLGTLLFCGISTMSLVYLLTSRLLNEQIDQRALSLSKNLADASAGLIATRNFLGVHALVAKYSFQDNVAYAFVSGRDGKMLAHSLGGQFPPELESDALIEEGKLSERRSLAFRNRPVYETVVPILAGQLGSAHVSLWGDIVDTEINKGLLPIIGLVGFLFLVAIAVSLLLSRHIVKRITRLQLTAERMSKGSLDEPVGVGFGDEIDRLSASLERMRTSLKAAMLRLSQAESQRGAGRQQGDRDEKASA